ncbi:gamma-glutamylcyclotransferase family protein [Roseivivax sp. CAU 1761]
MTNSFFFGYGSLVNCRTHKHAPAHPARARGWKRAWRAVPDRPLAFLTAVPDPEAEIEGLIAAVPDADWAALDQREEFYDRLDASAVVSHAAEGALRIAIYSVPETRSVAPHRAAPVLLSYLDVVLQGYLDVFGAEGAERFFATTEGWEAPVLDDRRAPLYPRAQTLTDAERAWVDDAMARHRVEVFDTV